MSFSPQKNHLPVSGLFVLLEDVVVTSRTELLVLLLTSLSSIYTRRVQLIHSVIYTNGYLSVNL